MGSLRVRLELSARRGFTRFIGRENELRQLEHSLHLALARCGQVYAVIGDAGAGKSRLLHEFGIVLSPEYMILHIQPVSHGRTSAYLPVLELLQKYFGIGGEEAPLEQREKIKAGLDRFDPGLRGLLPYLFALFGIQEAHDPLLHMDSQVKRNRTFDAINRVILRESLRRPVIVIFEDLHWIDSETQELLNLLTDSIGNSRVLLLVSYRPEYRHDWWKKACYSELRLEPLSAQNSAEMLSALIGDAAELEPVKRFVVERTEGNPFFIEEIVRALFEEGALIRNGTVTATHLLSQVRLPATVQGVLASRIDRLSSEQKEFLQMLAVIGRELPLSLIRRVVARADTEIEQVLTKLQENQFIYRQPEPGEVRFAFSHALTQEVGYGSLLIERRKSLHERTAAAIESLYAERLDDHLSELAHHYEHSGNAVKALEYLGRAGQQAAGRSAHAEASRLLTAALQLLHSFPETPERAERELALQLTLGMSLQVLRGWSAPELGDIYQRARALCQQVGETSHFSAALAGLLAFYVMRGELQIAGDLARQLLAIAEGQQDLGLLLRAQAAMGFTLIWPGQFATALAHLERASSLCDEVPQPSRDSLYAQLRADILGNLALTLTISGYPDQGADRVAQAVTLAREMRLPFSLAIALHLSSVIHSGRGEGEAALRYADEVTELATEHGFQLLRGYGICWRGVALIVNGNPEQGITHLRNGLALVRSTGSETAQTYWLTMMAAGYQLLGRAEEGLTVVAEALAAIEKTGERIAEAEVYRLKAELLLMTEDEFPSSAREHEAEQLLRQAIDVARVPGLKILGIERRHDTCAAPQRTGPPR